MRSFGTFDEMTRRAFVSGIARGALGLSTLPVLGHAALARRDDEVPLEPATARNVIYLFMSGGMSHIDMLDPKPGASTQGPTRVIDTNVPGIRIGEHLPNLARQMDKVCVVNSVKSNQGAHAQGRYYMHTSYELRGTIKHPSLGAWLNKMAGKDNPTLPGHVAIGNEEYMATAGFFESQYVPLPIGDPDAGLANSARHEGVDEETFDRRLSRLRQMNEAFRAKSNTQAIRAYADMLDEAVELMDSSDLTAFDLAKEPEDLRDAYGDSRFGKGCLLARRLVEHGVRFVEVVSGGWDTHNDNYESLQDLGPVLDRGLSALLADLDSRGMLEETLVVVATEFGRSPDITADRNGRNHHPQAFSCLLAGGGIAGGRTYGKTDEEGREVVEDPVTVKDLNATIACALGLPTEHEVYSPSGRPFKVANDGKPVKALFA